MTRKVLALLVGLMLMATVALAEDLSGVPEGLSFYAEPDFAVSSLVVLDGGEWVMGGFTNAAQDIDKVAAQVVCLGPDGTELWRYNEGLDAKYPVTSWVAGVLPDGDLLVLVDYLGAEQAKEPHTFLRLDAEGKATRHDALTEGVAGVTDPYSLRIVPEGFLVMMPPVSEDDVHSDAVLLGPDLSEIWRTQIPFTGHDASVAFVPVDDGFLAYGWNYDIDGDEGSDALAVMKLSADGEMAWIVDAGLGYGQFGPHDMAVMPDGGVVVFGCEQHTNEYGEPTDFDHLLTRLDKDGKVLWTQKGDHLAWNIAALGDRLVGSGFVSGDKTDISKLWLTDEQGEIIDEQTFGEVDGRQVYPVMQFAHGADGTLYAAGELVASVVGQTEVSEVPFGVVYGVLGEAFFGVE